VTRVLMFGYCPLPHEGLRVSAPGLRTWHFLQVLLAAGHEVCLIGDRTYGAYPDTLPDLVTHKTGKWTYHSVTDARWHNPSAMQALIKPFAADCAISVTTTASSVASELIGDLPLWADLYGSIMAEAQMKALVYSDDSYLAYFWNQERRAIERADIFSTVSERQKWSLVGELGMWGRLNQWTSGYDYATCIPIASETTPYAPTHKVIRGTLLKGQPDDQAFVILYSGGYNTWTDVDTLFNALEQVMKGAPDVHFVSTGGKIDGHDDLTYVRFQKMIESSAYRERFHLRGWVPNEDVPAYYLESNIGINVDRPSYEAMLGSRTRVLDWMRAGLPSVLSSLTELAEDVRKARAGLVYKPGSVDDLVSCLQQAINDRAETAAMGQRAHQLLCDRFTFEATTERLCAWVANPTHAPDYGRNVPKLVTASHGIGTELAQAMASRSLGLALAVRVWPIIARTTDMLGMGGLQRRLAKWGMHALRLDRSPYQVKYLDYTVPTQMHIGDDYEGSVTLRNVGSTPWIIPNQSEKAVNLSYHWIDKNKVMVLKEGRRSSFAENVLPNTTVTLALNISPPPTSGQYTLEIDLVSEGVAWFSEVSAPGPSVLIEVQPARNA